MGSYSKFAAMIFTSTLLMFLMMYLNTYETDHIFFSETRTYMAVMMGAGMAFVMLTFMMPMYKSKCCHLRGKCHRFCSHIVAGAQPKNGR